MDVNRATVRMAKRMARAGVVAAVAMLAACSHVTSESPRAEPFLAYRVALADAHLNVVHVTGTVWGASMKRFVLRSVPDASGARCEPLNFKAADRGGARCAVRAGNGAWVVENGGRDFSFDYDVVLTIEDRYAPDVRELITFMEEDRCRILGRDVFLVPNCVLADGVIVDFSIRPGWQIAASSPSVRGRMIVPSADELTTTLAASGAYRRLERTIGGSTIQLAIAGQWSFGDEEFFDVVGRIVSEEFALFGSSPRARYLFVCDSNPVQGGARFDYYGINYGGSMILLLDRNIDRSKLLDTPMAIVAHEFFHNWNGDSLRPEGNDCLWFTEGATVYYSYRILERASVITREQYARHRQELYDRYRANPYTARVPIGEAGNSDMHDKDMVSLLYDGGFLAAEALDNRLRDESGGSVSLMAVLKRMYGDAKGNGTMSEARLVRTARELSGRDYSAFLRRLVHTPDPDAITPRLSSLD